MHPSARWQTTYRPMTEGTPQMAHPPSWNGTCLLGRIRRRELSSMTTAQQERMLTARLHPIKRKRKGEVYSVMFRGQLLVERSSDPECDAARALLAKGITGKLTMLDGKTGRPRTVIDIERAALLCVKEGPVRFAPYESRPDRVSSPESEAGGL